MTPLLAAALELQSFFDRRQWKFCIIGGIALLRWGEPRFTRGVDVSLLSGFGREEEFIAPLRPLAELKEQKEIMEVFHKLQRA